MAYYLFRLSLLITEPSDLMEILKYIYVSFINITIFDKKELPTILHKSTKALKRVVLWVYLKWPLSTFIITRIELQGALILCYYEFYFQVSNHI